MAIVIAPAPAAISTPTRTAATRPVGGIAPRVRAGAVAIAVAPARGPGGRRSIGTPAATSLPVGAPAGAGGSVRTPPASGVGGGSRPSVGSPAPQPVQQ